MDAFKPDHFRATALAADEAAITAYRGGADDGGSCNFDCAVLHLPAAWREQLTATARGTGLRIHTRDWMCSAGELAYFVSSERTGGQGFARTRAAEAIQSTFRAAGYEGLTFYQMD